MDGMGDSAEDDRETISGKRVRSWRIRESDRHRTAVCEWLTANGVDCRAVPVDANASISNGLLTLPMLVLDEHGRGQIDPQQPNTLLRRTVAVTVKVPPTPDAELWLTKPWRKWRR